MKQYNVAGAGAGAGGGSADYQLVTLRLCSGDEAAGLGGIPSSATNGGGNASRSSLPACIAYLILFDDQVQMCWIETVIPAAFPTCATVVLIVI